MKKSELYKLMDLIEDVKKIDDLISQHREHGNSDFMISQYEAKKNEIMGSLIDELVSPPVQSTQSYHLVKKLVNKYYPLQSEGGFAADADMAILAAAI